MADCKQIEKGKQKGESENMINKNYMNVPTKKSKNHLEMKLVTPIVTKNHS